MKKQRDKRLKQIKSPPSQEQAELVGGRDTTPRKPAEWCILVLCPGLRGHVFACLFFGSSRAALVFFFLFLFFINERRTLTRTGPTLLGSGLCRPSILLAVQRAYTYLE